MNFNCHRIHYDLSYATEVEGVPGLVVHGPLLAKWLSLFAARKSRRKLKKFRFRAMRPVFDLHNFNLIGDFTGKRYCEHTCAGSPVSIGNRSRSRVYPVVTGKIRAPTFQKPGPVRQKDGRTLEQILLIQNHLR